MFEVGDCVIVDDNEIGAKNVRHLCAVFTDHDNAGLEIIHGLLDHLMKKIDVKFDAENGKFI